METFNESYERRLKEEKRRHKEAQEWNRFRIEEQERMNAKLGPELVAKLREAGLRPNHWRGWRVTYTEWSSYTGYRDVPHTYILTRKGAILQEGKPLMRYNPAGLDREHRQLTSAVIDFIVATKL